MYRVFEHRAVAKCLKKTPLAIQRNYVAWKRIVEVDGPRGLRWITGFHDEALKGEWRGFRSSRLNRQWRVIYHVDQDQCAVYVLEINPHIY